MSTFAPEQHFYKLVSTIQWLYFKRLLFKIQELYIQKLPAEISTKVGKFSTQTDFFKSINPLKFNF